MILLKQFVEYLVTWIQRKYAEKDRKSEREIYLILSSDSSWLVDIENAAEKESGRYRGSNKIGDGST